MPRNGSETLPLPGILPPATLTSEASLTCNPMTSPNTSSVISSPGSAAGLTRSASPAGPTIAPSGPAPVRVSRFRAQDSTRAMPINDTSGPLFSASSPSAGLQSSLENRLRARTDVNGSPEYVLTWKHWDMPAGPPICALRASARHTSGNGCSGWQTPMAGSQRKSARAISREGNSRLGGGQRSPPGLEQQAELAVGIRPKEMVGYATPRAIDGRPKGNGPRPDTLTGQMHYGSDRKRLAGGALNPDFVSWLMGYPLDWPGCAP